MRASNSIVNLINVCNFKVKIKKLRLKIMSDKIQEIAEVDESSLAKLKVFILNILYKYDKIFYILSFFIYLLYFLLYYIIIKNFNIFSLFLLSVLFRL